MPRDGDKIGPAAKPVRKRRTTLLTTPRSRPSAASNIPPAGSGDAGGEGQSVVDNHEKGALAEITKRLVSLQKVRRFCITQQSRADRSIEALIASADGFRIDQDEKDRKAAFARAKAFRLSVEKAGEVQSSLVPQESDALSALVPLVLASAASRETWDDLRATAVKEMEQLSKSLPTYDFAKSVRGLGDLGHAAIAANAGIPIGEYRTVSGLWKRMGLAVIKGERQRKKKDADDAAEHGYSPTRRADLWAFCSDSMFRAQWAGDKDKDGHDPTKTGEPVAVPAHPIGPYGDVYGRRRAHTEPRIAATADLPNGHPDKWTKARCRNDARRVMTKAVLRDLWRVAHGLPPRF